MIPKLTREPSGDYSLSGSLSFSNVPALYNDSSIDMSKDHVSVSLRDVDQSDSAGLALLVEWLRLAEKRRCRLTYTDIPSHLRTLIDVTGLSPIIDQAAR